MRTKQSLTDEQILDWLIYHVPMVPVTGFPVCLRYPFRVTFYGPGGYGSVANSTPWGAYRELAHYVCNNLQLRNYISEMYYYS